MASLRQTLAESPIADPADPSLAPLAGLLLPDEEAAAVAERYAQWESSLRPDNAFEVWLAEQVAAEAVEVERARAHLAARRTLFARRAALRWDDDRLAEADRLGARLPRDPAGVARQLRETLHGSRWLAHHLDALARAGEARGAWTDAERTRALDLLGVPRGDRAGAAPDFPALRAEVARLEVAQAKSLAELDRAERAAASRGAGPVIDRELAPLHRLLRSACRRQEACLARFRQARRPYPAAGSTPARPLYAPPPTYRADPVAVPIPPPPPAIESEAPTAADPAGPADVATVLAMARSLNRTLGDVPPAPGSSRSRPDRGRTPAPGATPDPPPAQRPARRASAATVPRRRG